MKQVSLIGFGPGHEGMLTCAARDALEQADLIIGAQRLLDLLPLASTEVRIAAVHDEEIAKHLAALDNWRKACVILSGDVGIFSGAKRLRAHLTTYEVVTVAGISSVQYFAALLQRPWQDWRFASAHGVACNLATLLDAHHPLFLVTGGKNTVASLCEKLCDLGHEQARVTVGECLSYANERVVEGSAENFCSTPFDALSVMLIEVAEVAKTPAWPWATPGIPDDKFVRGSVPMTKQEVRVVALSKLRLAPHDTVYDIGAGTGSISVEAALLCPQGQVYAIERNAEAVTLIRENTRRFGVSNVIIREGLAPAVLADLPAPDAVYIGGSGKALPEILDCVHAANAQVRVCISCVTLETLSQTLTLLSGSSFTNFEAVQVAISRAEATGSYHLMRAQNPVFLVSAQGVGYEA